MYTQGLDILVAAATLVLALALLRASWIDRRTMRLPDGLTLPLIPLGLLVSAARLGAWPIEQAIGAALGFGCFYVLGEAYFRAKGVDGLGIGDAKLFAAAGAWLGIGALPWVALGAALPAIVVLSLSGDRSRALAFGPYLSAAFFVIWLYMILGSR